jgi:hypothetical protein
MTATAGAMTHPPFPMPPGVTSCSSSPVSAPAAFSAIPDGASAAAFSLRAATVRALRTHRAIRRHRQIPRAFVAQRHAHRTVYARRQPGDAGGSDRPFRGWGQARSAPSAMSNSVQTCNPENRTSLPAACKPASSSRHGQLQLPQDVPHRGQGFFRPTPTADHQIVGIIHDVHLQTLFVSQLFPAEYEPAHW